MQPEAAAIRPPVRLDFDMGDAVRTPKPGAPRDRPWRKSASEVAAERRRAQLLLGEPAGGGVDLAALQYTLRVQERLDAQPEGAHADVQAAVTRLLQAATNACHAKEVAAARAAVEREAGAAGLGSAAESSAADGHMRPGEPRSLSGLPKLQLLHQVMPRLWLGGWAALNNDCEALRSRRITHVVSIVSADQRRLPSFITAHYYACVDDRDAAGEELAAHFEPAVAFIEEARAAGRSVFVHCGAGISRAPSVTIAYVMWKLGLGAADALPPVEKPSALSDDPAPFASLDHSQAAQAAPTHPRAQPEQLGGVSWPQQPASGRTEAEELPLSTRRRCASSRAPAPACGPTRALWRSSRRGRPSSRPKAARRRRADLLCPYLVCRSLARHAASLSRLIGDR